MKFWKTIFSTLTKASGLYRTGTFLFPFIKAYSLLAQNLFSLFTREILSWLVSGWSFGFYIRGVWFLKQAYWNASVHVMYITRACTEYKEQLAHQNHQCARPHQIYAPGSSCKLRDLGSSKSDHGPQTMVFTYFPHSSPCFSCVSPWPLNYQFDRDYTI